MAVWAFAEALVWPIIPDFLLALMIVSRPARWRRLLIVTVLGSTLGGTVLFTLASLFPERALATLPLLPLVFSSDIDHVQLLLSELGSVAYLQQPMSGVPFKIWGITGGAMGLSFLAAGPIFVLARSLRMVAVALVAMLIGRQCTRIIHRYPKQLLAIYITVFVAGWVRTMPLGR